MEDKSSQVGLAWRFVCVFLDENPAFEFDRDEDENALTSRQRKRSAVQNIPFIARLVLFASCCAWW